MAMTIDAEQEFLSIFLQGLLEELLVRDHLRENKIVFMWVNTIEILSC